MPRRNSSNASVGDQFTAVRWQDINEDLDDLYSNGSDRGRVYMAISGTALRVDIGAFAYVVGITYGTYAGSTDNVVTDSATNYVMINSSGTIVINTTGFLATHARLATVVCSGGVVTSITIAKPDAFGGDLSGTNPQVTATTLSGNVTLANADDSYQRLNPNGTNRDVTLGTTIVPEGRFFFISNEDTVATLTVKQASTPVMSLYPGEVGLFIYDGTNWFTLSRRVNTMFGNGSDGPLAVSAGTTTIDLGGANIVIKNYTTINVTGGTLAFSNPAANGTIVILRSTGAQTWSGGTVDLRNIGSVGAPTNTYALTTGNGHQNGSAGTEAYNNLGQTRKGTGGSGSIGASSAVATVGGVPGNMSSSITAALVGLVQGGITIAPGNGGGAGGAAILVQGSPSGTWTANAGAGGRGGGSLILYSGGNYNDTGCTFNLSGTAGADASVTPGTSSQSAIGAAGGTGGASGDFLALVDSTKTIISGATYILSGGVGGAGATYSNGGSTGTGPTGTTGADGIARVVPVIS